MLFYASVQAITVAHQSLAYAMTLQDHSGVEVKPKISQTFEQCTSRSSENSPQLLPTFRLMRDE